jgi:hypothetical protein
VDAAMAKTMIMAVKEGMERSHTHTSKHTYICIHTCILIHGFVHTFQGLVDVKYDDTGVDAAMAKTMNIAVEEGMEIPGLQGHVKDLGNWMKASL